MQNYDLKSIALTVLLFDLAALMALCVAYWELAESQRSHLRVWLLGMALSIASTLLTTFSSYLPNGWRGAIPHVFFCASTMCFWWALRRFAGKGIQPAWTWLLVAFQCAWVAFIQDRIQAALVISTTALALQLSAAFAALHFLPGAWQRRGAHWVVASGFMVVSIAMAYRVGLWLLYPETNLADVGMVRASARAFSGAGTVICSLGFVLMCSAQIARELRKAALTDPLTKLPNRRAILEVLNVACKRNQAPAAGFAMMIDVDHFKQINDRFGHAAGDQALILIAQQLRSSLGEHGTLARIGGEEFLAWAPNISAEASAVSLAQQLRTDAFAQCLTLKDGNTHAPTEVQLSVSIGLTALGSNDRVENLLRRADDALYQAKACGRNRVHLDAQAR